MKSFKLSLLIGILGLAAAANAAEDYIVIANSSSKANSISRAELKAIFFGNRTNFDGNTAEPCLLGSKEGEGFFSSVLGVSKSQFNQEWVKKELTGAGRAPKSRDSIDDVIACVTGDKGGIGFIPRTSAGKADGKVRVLDFAD